MEQSTLRRITILAETLMKQDNSIDKETAGKHLSKTNSAV